MQDCHLRISQGISIYNHKDVRTYLYLQSGARPVHCQWGRELRTPEVCRGICEGEYRYVRTSEAAKQAEPEHYPLGMEPFSEETAHQ